MLWLAAGCAAAGRCLVLSSIVLVFFLAGGPTISFHNMNDPQFEQAAAAVQGMKKLNNEQKLQFYGLYKQGTVGDVTTSAGKRPGMFDMVGQAKWDAWKEVQGLSKEEAQRRYIQTVAEITKGNSTSSTTATATVVTRGGSTSAPITTTATSTTTSSSEKQEDEDGGFGGMGNSVSTFSHRSEDVAWNPQQSIFQAIVQDRIDHVRACFQTVPYASVNEREKIKRIANQRDENEMTPLHFAADRGLKEITDLLLQSGANVNAADADGQTPLMLAVLCEHEVIMEHLHLHPHPLLLFLLLLIMISHRGGVLSNELKILLPHRTSPSLLVTHLTNIPPSY